MNFSGFYIVRPKSCKTKKIEIKKNTYDLIDKHDQKTWYRTDIDFRNSLQNQNMCGHVQIHHSVHILKIKKKYRIRLNTAPGFYFSKWIFGWGSIRNIPQKVDFLAKKWGFIQEKPQKHDFSHYMGLYSRVGLHSSGYGS